MYATDVKEPLPNRRRSWTREVQIGNQTVILSVGEYADGRPGEVFIDLLGVGTTTNGLLGTLARVVSMTLQDGGDITTIIRSLRGITYPPEGMVYGSAVVQRCSSVTDWIASELEAQYVVRESNATSAA